MNRQSSENGRVNYKIQTVCFFLLALAFLTANCFANLHTTSAPSNQFNAWAHSPSVANHNYDATGLNETDYDTHNPPQNAIGNLRCSLTTHEALGHQFTPAVIDTSATTTLFAFTNQQFLGEYSTAIPTFSSATHTASKTTEGNKIIGQLFREYAGSAYFAEIEAVAGPTDDTQIIPVSNAPGATRQGYNLACDEFCKTLSFDCNAKQWFAREKFNIDLFGWSRGVMVVYKIASKLNNPGCSCNVKCCDSFGATQLFQSPRYSVPVRFLGMIDAVSTASLLFIPSPATIPTNVKSSVHEQRDGTVTPLKDAIFVRHFFNGPQHRRFHWRASHGQIGRTDTPVGRAVKAHLKAMADAAITAGT